MALDAETQQERQKRAADDLWKELTEGDGRANDHDHWERIVRRSLRWRDPSYEDDTRHIANVQEYYRYVLEEQDWEEEERDRQQELASLMRTFFTNDGDGRARVQEGGRQNDKDIQKPIPGRYIVMLDSSASGEMLDRTVAVLQRAHAESEGRIRADHITTIRSLGGFTATMNSKAVELVSAECVSVCVLLWVCRWGEQWLYVAIAHLVCYAPLTKGKVCQNSYTHTCYNLHIAT